MPPYRDPPREKLVAIEPPRRKPRRLWLWGPTIAIAAGTFVLGVGELALAVVIAGGLVSVGVQALARRGAYDRLEKLPFPITHDPLLGTAADSPQGRPIDGVEIRLREPLDGLAAEQVGTLASAAAPELSVHIDGDRIALTGWAWGEEDAVRLAELLSTWGLELHRAHPITQVAVTWGRGGPSPAM